MFYGTATTLSGIEVKTGNGWPPWFALPLCCSGRLAGSGCKNGTVGWFGAVGFNQLRVIFAAMDTRQASRPAVVNTSNAMTPSSGPPRHSAISPARSVTPKRRTGTTTPVHAKASCMPVWVGVALVPARAPRPRHALRGATTVAEDTAQANSNCINEVSCAFRNACLKAFSSMPNLQNARIVTPIMRLAILLNRQGFPALQPYFLIAAGLGLHLGCAAFSCISCTKWRRAPHHVLRVVGAMPCRVGIGSTEKDLRGGIKISPRAGAPSPKPIELRRKFGVTPRDSAPRASENTDKNLGNRAVNRLFPMIRPRLLGLRSRRRHKKTRPMARFAGRQATAVSGRLAEPSRQRERNVLFDAFERSHVART
ncbi:hypothetical protein SAMN05421548_105114 [Paraburkholderia lycopersici]|uniref:Uncharacterized protein n=1 Tax=Paraburkholderia lycopersici TaxID=416944 RepID=A0A1G6K7H3_9BURK|nr:hypothetical protein SAMN05421548_105114 [Paraburkholderia lycopersici]